MRFPSRPTPFLKICCIQSVAEARLAIANGADALGLVSEMPTGPGPIEERTIAEIVEATQGVETFLLTCVTDAATIIGQLRRTRASIVQLVDAVDTDTLSSIADALPDVGIVPVVHVQDAEARREALDYASHAAVHGVLLDSGNPSAKELGGTGRVHDWQTSAVIVRESPKPVFLAGGLRSDNVVDAISTVKPYGLDLCTGVRSHGALDAKKLIGFVRSFRSTDST
ncbi:MAG: phosphoribosylanthranilate isomerase [Polyangiales bacterium]